MNMARVGIFFIFFIFILLGFISKYICKTQQERKLIYWCSSIILILFAGLREIGIDKDSLSYSYFYDSELIFVLAEPTFAWISLIVRYIFNNFSYVLFFYAILGVLIKYKAIEKLTEFHYLTLLVYISTYYLLHEFTQIRVSIASGIFLIAIPFLAERRFYKYFVLILIATLFHYSALILLPLFLLSNKAPNRYFKIFMWLSIPLGVIFAKINFNPMLAIPIETVRLKVEIYTETQNEAEISLNIFNRVYLVKYLMFYLLLFYYPILSSKVKYFSLFLKIYALSLFFYTALSNNTIFAMRVSELLGIVEIFLVPTLYWIIKPRQVAVLLICFIAFIYLLINIFSIELIQSVPITSYG